MWTGGGKLFSCIYLSYTQDIYAVFPGYFSLPFPQTELIKANRQIGIGGMRGEFLLKAGKPVLTEKEKQSLQSRDGSRGFAPSPPHASQAKPRKKEDKRREAVWMGFPRPLPAAAASLRGGECASVSFRSSGKWWGGGVYVAAGGSCPRY